MGATEALIDGFLSRFNQHKNLVGAGAGLAALGGLGTYAITKRDAIKRFIADARQNWEEGQRLYKWEEEHPEESQRLYVREMKKIYNQRNKKAADGETVRDLALGTGIGGAIGAGSAAHAVLGRTGRRLPARLTKRIFAGRSALGGLTGLAVAGLLGRNNQPKRYEYYYHR